MADSPNGIFFDPKLLNAEAALLAHEEARKAEIVTQLWLQPTLADSEIPIAAKLPASLWAECKKSGDSPPLFTVGRRLFVRTADLKKWLDQKAAAGKPGSKRLRAKAALDVEPEGEAA